MAALTARDAHPAPGDGGRVEGPDAARPNGPLSFAGRLGVLGANARLLVATLALVVAGFVAGALFPVDTVFSDGALDSVRFPTGMVLVSGVSALVALPFTLSALVLRCHDRGHSGWWLLLSLVPIVGALFLLYLLAWPGRDAPNLFGPRRAATALEKLVGALGLVLAVLSLVATALMVPRLTASFEEVVRGYGLPGTPVEAPGSPGSPEAPGGDAGPFEVR